MTEKISNIINKEYGSDSGQYYRKKEPYKIDNLVNEYTERISIINEKERISDIKHIGEKIDDLSQ